MSGQTLKVIGADLGLCGGLSWPGCFPVDTGFVDLGPVVNIMG